MKPSFFVVTDSTADLRSTEKSKYEIRVVPLRVMFGDDVFLDGEQISQRDFYDRWAESKFDPITSPPTPQAVYEVYRSIIQAHPDARILSIHISSGLSSTIRSAQMARTMIAKPDQVTVFDGKSCSYGTGVLAIKAAMMSRAGLNVEQAVMKLQLLTGRQKIYLLVDQLVHLQRGGRISLASQWIGTLMNIKPILMIDPNGAITTFDKVRGRKGAIHRIADAIVGDFGANRISVTLMHADGQELAEQFEEIFNEKLNLKELDTRLVSPVIGAHVGSGAVAILARWDDES
jgi:DegV family protein with EDD domain